MLELDHFVELTEKKAFLNHIGVIIAQESRTGVTDVTLEVWEHESGSIQEIMKVNFFGGGFGIRNVNMNSNSANFRELGKMLDGGCYEEVGWYEQFVKNAESNHWKQII